MAIDQPIVLCPPGEDGGRRVHAGARFLGKAYGLLDVVELLRHTGRLRAGEWLATHP
jgi:hypothetical protein